MLLALTSVLVAVWLHGMIRARWYRRELAQHDPQRVTVAVPGLVSPIAASARLRAELARAERVGGTAYVAVARTSPEFDQLASARAIADSLPEDTLGILWDAGVVIVTSAATFDVDALPAPTGTKWQSISTAQMTDIDTLVAA